jgi:hypothetical protein
MWAIKMRVIAELGCTSGAIAMTVVQLISRGKTWLATAIGPELISLHRSLGVAAHALTFTACAIDLLDEVPDVLRP